MLIDLKPTITQALRSNAALVSLLGRDKWGNVRVYPQVSPDMNGSYVTFFELTNFDNKFASDQPISSEIHMQIDIWTPGDTAPIALAVNETMEGLGFFRRGAHDRYESDSETYHKILRYSKTHFGG